MRRTILSITTGLMTGFLALGVAWATAGLTPQSTSAAPQPKKTKTPSPTPTPSPTASPSPTRVEFPPGRLPGGVFKVGAVDTSIAPIPVSEGGKWNAHGADHDCGPIGYEYLPDSDPSCLRSFDRVWATGVDQTHDLGIFARTMAISNGEDTLVFVVLDTVSWFYGYDPSICPHDPDALQPQDTCGTRAITLDLSHKLGIPVENFVIASTHTHASADTTARGPSWYYEYVRDQIKESVTEAVGSMEYAELETGSIPAKAFNIDRRRVTRAVPDSELGWLRAVSLNDPGKTISTLVNFSAHTTVTAGNADMHSGFIGHLSKRLNELWGGTTVFMPGGLGDQTVERSLGRDGIGYGLANYVYESAKQSAYTLESNEIVAKQKIVTIPADNVSLVAMNKAGIFMRDSTVPGPHAQDLRKACSKWGVGAPPAVWERAP